jgi:hypothetical protein
MYQVKYLSQEAASVPPVYGGGVRKEIPRHETLLTYNPVISK